MLNFSNSKVFELYFAKIYVGNICSAQQQVNGTDKRLDR